MACVALVRPPSVLPLTTVPIQFGTPAIGMAYLLGSLKAAGHRVAGVDAFGEAPDQFTRIPESGLLINGIVASQIVDKIPSDVDCIGVSCMFSNEWIYAKLVIRELAKRFPGVPIIVGGEHVTADTEYVLASAPQILCGVLGEGEETLVELIACLESKGDLGQVQGIAYRGFDGRVMTTGRRKRRTSIDEIPLPAWEELPLETYVSQSIGMAAYGCRPMPMVATRGCPFQCTFCSNPRMWEAKWIARDPGQVVAEMRSYVEKYGANHFEFYDLTAIVSKPWTMEFTRRLMEEKLDITWALPSGTRSEALDQEALDALHKSGCTKLNYAPESGSPTTLARIKKRVKLEDMLRSMRHCAKTGIISRANMIFGFPGQTFREVLESYWFIVRLAWVGIDDVASFPFVPYPGSELYYKLVSDGRIRRDGEEYERFLANNVTQDVKKMRSWSEYFSNRQIWWIVMSSMALFYSLQFLFRPQRILRLLRELGSARPQTCLGLAFYGIYRNFIQGRKTACREVIIEVAPGSHPPARI